MLIDQFRTKRLTAERLPTKHLAKLMAMHSDPRLMATLEGTRSLEVTKEYLTANLQHWEQYRFGLFTIQHRDLS